MRILITGATGLVGKKLGLKLFREGHELFVTSRSKQKASLELPFPAEICVGDLSQGTVKVPAVDAVIHLMGEGVADKRWSAEQKRRLTESRVNATQNLLASLSHPPQVFLSASAIGFYGDRPGEILNEATPSGDSYISRLCVDWEKALTGLPQQVRRVVFRIGIVLDRDGGALGKMLFPFRAGVGGCLGSGQQMMSWIHIDDLVNMFAESLNDSHIHGVINAVAGVDSNYNFSKTLAETLNRPLGPKVPAVALKLALGEMSQVVLSDQNIKSRWTTELKKRFRFSDIQSALEDLLKHQAQGEDLFEVHQFIPHPVEKVFPFFAEAKNLETITPPNLNFRILGSSTQQVQQGTLIEYKLRIRGVPVYWKTLIEQWQDNKMFVDTQLKGPYKLWHHTHEFESVKGGTLMTDRVRFRLPMGFIGWLVAGYWVAQDVKKIFAYRKKVITEIHWLQEVRNALRT